jgi:hypothetical protein
MKRNKAETYRTEESSMKRQTTLDWNLRKYFMTSEAAEISNSEITYDLCDDQPPNHSNKTE